MNATLKILKNGCVNAESILLFPLCIIEIIIQVFLRILSYFKIQFIFPYIMMIIIIAIMFFNIWAIVFQNKYKKSHMFLLIIFTYPIFAEFPEIQLNICCLKITLLVTWLTEIIKEYIFFNKSNDFFSRNMIVMFTMICIISELGISYILLAMLLLLMIVNLLNVSKIK